MHTVGSFHSPSAARKSEGCTNRLTLLRQSSQHRPTKQMRCKSAGRHGSVKTATTKTEQRDAQNAKRSASSCGVGLDQLRLVVPKRAAMADMQELADKLEIQELLTRYATAVDTRDWDLFTQCFTADATIDYTAAGGIEGTLPVVRAWLAEVLAGFVMTQHLVTNFHIRLDGDVAECRSSLFNPMGMSDGEGGVVVFLEGGYYYDRLVRTPEGWRIQRRVIEVTFSTRNNPVWLQPFVPG
jgi:hypothetical protein